MMNKSLSLILAFILALPSFVIPAEAAKPKPRPADPQTQSSYNVEKECPKGRCVEGLIDLAKNKTSQAMRDRCLPPASEKNQEAWFEKNPMTLECFKLVKEIEEIHEKLEKIQAHFSGEVLAEQENMCRADAGKGFSINGLSELNQVAEQAACSPQRKKEIWNKCGSDVACVMLSTATSFAGPFANRLIPKGLKAKGCDANKDDCLKQLATAFVKAVFSFFEGTWGLLKSAGRGIVNAGKKFWSWVSGAEKKSSTAQLAAAKASEEEGIFRQLMNDFTGTMSRIWSGLVGALKHWLANDIFCQEWAGTPRFSECKRPAQGLDCTECKAMLTGLCSVAGVIIAEIVPSFVTGGLVSAAKYGASGAAKIAKLFKVSKATNAALKGSRIAKMMNPVAKAVRTVATSRVTRVAVSVISKTLSALNRYLLQPSVKALKVSLRKMHAVAKVSKTYIMMTPAGPVLSFGGKAISNTFKVVMFPFENAMTVKAFQLGERTMDKVFQGIGKAKLFSAVRPALSPTAASAMGAIDDAYLEMQVTRFAKRRGSQFISQAEENYIHTVRLKRAGIIDDFLAKKPNMQLKDIIDDLYPELNYGKFAKYVDADDILASERSLMNSIGKMADGPEKNRLMAEMQKHLSNTSRADVLVGSPTYSRSQVIENAMLDDEVRITKALEATQIDPSKVEPELLEKMKLGIKEAHEIGDGGVYRYTYSDINKKYRRLNEAGFTNKQAEALIRSGLAGKANPENMYDALKLVVVPDVSPSMLDEMVKSTDYGPILSKVPEARRSSTAKALMVLEDGVDSSDEAAKIFDQFKDHFEHVQKLSTTDSDAASMLADFIRKQRQAGVADDVIKQKIVTAFGACP